MIAGLFLDRTFILLKKIYQQWFIISLLFIFLITIIDSSGIVSEAGRWLRAHNGTDIVIILIFFISGLLLSAELIKAGFQDIKGLILALFLVFIVSPAVAAIFSLAPINPEIKIGIFLVAVMPSTLSSGVVMTGAAGGNMAHALLITVLANSLSVITIPAALSMLLLIIGDNSAVSFNKISIMIKIFWCVLVPLALGLTTKYFIKQIPLKLERKLQLLNQVFVLSIVWTALSQSKHTILGAGRLFFVILFIVILFHGILLLFSFLFTKIFNIKKGQRESVIFMGGQKTLPLSVILQVTLFPQYGMALVVCVVHHIMHLIMDGYLVVKLKKQFPWP
jgi:sodium/bile acid cotransporter 7